MKKYFLHAPYFLKFMIINIYGLILRKKRYNQDFYQNLEFYIKNDKSEIFSFNVNRFKEQIKHSCFYKGDFKSIQKYPIITKENIKDHYDEIINNREINTYLYTSGTTGSGLKFPVSKEFINHQWAIFWKFRIIHGITLNTWCANIISQTMFTAEQNESPYWFKSYSTYQLLLSLYHIRNDTIKEYIEVIKKNEITWLHAFPSALNYLSNLIKENDLLEDAKKLNLKIITTSSEKLFDHQKQNIENIFGCSVRQLYGLTEGVVNIFECEQGMLHIDETYSYVELVPIENENEYKIIGTSYHNKAFPLVRYDSGDTCTLYPDGLKCECGRKSRVVKEILGRDDDHLILSNGGKVGRLSSIFKLLWAVKEAQIVQEKAGSAEFRVVKNKEYTFKDEKKLKVQIEEKLGKDFIFKIKYLDKIERTKSGKLKFVVNGVDRNDNNS